MSLSNLILKHKSNIIPFFARGFFSVLNILIIWTLVFFHGKENIGYILFLYSSSLIFCSLIRFGWEQNIIADLKKNKIYILNAFFSSIISIPFIYLYAKSDFESAVIFFAFLFINISANLESSLRIIEKSKISYFIVLNAPMTALLVSSFIFMDPLKIYLSLCIFNFLILFIAFNLLGKPNFSFQLISIKDGLKSFVLALHGSLNQNIFQVTFGALGLNYLIPAIITVHRITNVLIWPIHFYSFYKGGMIKFEKKRFIETRENISFVTNIFFVILVVLLFFVFNYDKNLIINSLLILIASLIFSLKSDNMFINVYNYKIAHIYLAQLILLSCLGILFLPFIDGYPYSYIITIFYIVYISLICKR